MIRSNSQTSLSSCVLEPLIDNCKLVLIFGFTCLEELDKRHGYPSGMNRRSGFSFLFLLFLVFSVCGLALCICMYVHLCACVPQEKCRGSENKFRVRLTFQLVCRLSHVAHCCMW